MRKLEIALYVYQKDAQRHASKRRVAAMRVMSAFALIESQGNILPMCGSRKNPDALWREVLIRKSLVPVLEKWQAKDNGTAISFTMVERLNIASGKKPPQEGRDRFSGRYVDTIQLTTEMICVNNIQSLLACRQPVWHHAK